ncbi:uncharacterized protein LOC113294425 [Papaver somniferum]|uniref:uncharacterized protein LOC113294425 n=1 Tax=Papaver somniferum TaxID=3469 RepID=UPI000E702576|nr:uncharacterized protein LOC113294425 [Papaver somniferum]
MASLEHVCLFIAGQPFVARPWTLLVEQELAELKTVPIWINMRNVPLHLWNVKGLGKLASFIGVPLMLDKQTATRSRMNYAMVFVEVTVDSDLPSHIDALVGNTKIKVPVEYTWKPQKCSHCVVFGHTQNKCVAAIVAAFVAAANLAADEAAKKLIATTAEQSKKAGGNEGWVVKNLKRGRSKNFNKENISSSSGGASSSGTKSVIENPLSVKNKFHQLDGDTTIDNMEVTLSSGSKDNGNILTPSSLENGVGVMETSKTLEVQDGTGISQMNVEEGSRFVQSQVEKLDVTQKGGELDGARVHFLRKSSIQGKNVLNVKDTEKKPGKIKKSNPPLV